MNFKIFESSRKEWQYNGLSLRNVDLLDKRIDIKRVSLDLVNN